MIEHETTFEVAKARPEVFAFLQDFANAPRWLSQCVELKQVSSPPTAVGS